MSENPGRQFFEHGKNGFVNCDNTLVGGHKTITLHLTKVNENKSDIHIGETERIHWVEFDASSNDLFDVDYIVGKYDDFWTFLQIFCVPDCCGLDAFRFYPNDIVNAASHIDKGALKQDLSKLKLELVDSDKEIIISSRLNNLVDKNVFIKLLDHILENL